MWLYKNFLPDNISRHKIYIIHYGNVGITLKNGDITDFMFLGKYTMEIELTINEKLMYIHIYCDEESGSIYFEEIEEIDSELFNFYTENSQEEYIYTCDTPEEFKFFKNLEDEPLEHFQPFGKA